MQGGHQKTTQGDDIKIMKQGRSTSISAKLYKRMNFLSFSIHVLNKYSLTYDSSLLSLTEYCIERNLA